MILKKFSLFLLSLVTSLVITGCSTIVKPLDSVYWHGKDDTEFFARKRMPDTAMRCIKDNKVSYVYGYELSLYDLQSYEVGRNDTTIFMTTQKVYTGGTTWTYLFTDENHKITSLREASGFGDIEKEFKCGAYEEAVTTAPAKGKKNPNVKPRLWAAIVGSPSSKRMMWGSDNAYPTIEEAKNDAMKQCEEQHGSDCNLVIAVSNMCVGFGYGDRNGSSFDVFGVGITPERSQKSALRKCDKDGASNCRLSPAKPLCALPHEGLVNNKHLFEQPQAFVPNVNDNKPFDVFLEGYSPIDEQSQSYLQKMKNGKALLQE